LKTISRKKTLKGRRWQRTGKAANLGMRKNLKLVKIEVKASRGSKIRERNTKRKSAQTGLQGCTNVNRKDFSAGKNQASK
jgi:hypothetical protein